MGVLIVGDPNKGKSELAKGAENRRMRVRWWEEIWEVAEGVEKADLPGECGGCDACTGYWASGA